PDRAHNETLDSMAAYGAVGLAARAAIEYVALAAAFTVFGWLAPSERKRFAAFVLVINTCAVGAACAWSGAWMLAISVPIAFVLVASIWIVWSGSRFEPAPRHDFRVVAAGAT